MTFTGQQLNKLGCPPDKIKFFVGKEFASEADLMEAIKNHRKTPARTDEEKEIARVLQEDENCAFNVLLELGLFPGCVPYGTLPSKRQLRQWLEQGAIRVNGRFPEPQNHVDFPITDLVFFPGAKSQTTLAGPLEDEEDYYFKYPTSRQPGQYKCHWTPEELAELKTHTYLMVKHESRIPV